MGMYIALNINCIFPERGGVSDVPRERPVAVKTQMQYNCQKILLVFKSPVRSGYWVPNMVTETLTG